MTFSIVRPHVCPKCDGIKVVPSDLPCVTCNGQGVVWERLVGSGDPHLDTDGRDLRTKEEVENFQQEFENLFNNEVRTTPFQTKLDTAASQKEAQELLYKRLEHLAKSKEAREAYEKSCEETQPLLDAFEKSKTLPRPYTITKECLQSLLDSLDDYNDWNRVVQAFDWFNGQHPFPIPERFDGAALANSFKLCNSTSSDLNAPWYNDHTCNTCEKRIKISEVYNMGKCPLCNGIGTVNAPHDTDGMYDGEPRTNETDPEWREYLTKRECLIKAGKEPTHKAEKLDPSKASKEPEPKIDRFIYDSDDEQWPT